MNFALRVFAIPALIGILSGDLVDGLNLHTIPDLAISVPLAFGLSFAWILVSDKNKWLQ